MTFIAAPPPHLYKPELCTLVAGFEAQFDGQPKLAIYQLMKQISLRVHLTIFLAFALPVAIPVGLLSIQSSRPLIVCLSGLFYAVFVAVIQAIRACRYSVDDSTSLKIFRSEAPGLFELIDDVADYFDSEVHEVFITSGFNASACFYRSIPQFFRPTRQLRFGIALFHGTTIEELRGIIAHEMLHLTAKSKAGNIWVRSAQSASWHARKSRLPVFNRWMRAWHKQLWALSIVIGKRDEFLGDQAAANLGVGKPFAVSLIRAQILGSLIEEKCPLFEPEYRLNSEKPPEDFIDAYHNWFDSALQDRELVDSTYSRELSRVYSIKEFHPSFKDRLEAIGMLPDVLDDSWYEAVAMIEPSASTLLGVNLPVFTQKIYSLKYDSISEQWVRHYQHYQRIKPLFESNENVKNVRDAWSRYHATATFQGQAEADKWLSVILELAPDNTIAQRRLAVSQLSRMDTTGLATLEEFTKETQDTIVATESIDALAEYYEKTGDTRSLFEVDKKRDLIRVRLEQIQREKKPRFFARFAPPFAAKNTFGLFHSIFAEEPGIQSVHVARMELSCPSTRHFVLVVTFRSGHRDPNRTIRSLEKKLMLNEATFYLLAAPTVIFLAGRIKRMTGTNIYQAKNVIEKSAAK